MSTFPLKLWSTLGAVGIAVLASTPSLAAPAAQDVFPAETVFWLSLPDTPAFDEKFSRTQIGLLAQDETLKPFAEHIRRQSLDRLGEVRDTLGVSLDDVMSAAGGELAIGVAHREGKRAVSVLLIDPAGKRAEADALIRKVDAALTGRGSKKSTMNLGGAAGTVYQLPQDDDAKIDREDLVLFESGGLICFVETPAEAQAVLARIAGQGAPALSSNPAFVKTMQRCEQAYDGGPDARWFLAPFKYDLARRSREAKPALADKKDTLTILREQGFDAIEGVGGHVEVAVDAVKDFVHRTAVYAPPKAGTEGKPAKDRYELGMRMAETPNVATLDVERWAPRSTANYSTFSIDIQNGFENLESVFDAMSGYEGAFRYTLEGFERDEFGPQIKVREQIIAHLGDRVTRMADYQLPITTDCERFLFVIEATNPAALQDPIDKWMDTDGAILQEVRGVKYWEILPEDETAVTVPLGGGLISPIDSAASDPAEEEFLRRAAVCVHNGHLIIASDVEFLEQAVFGVDPTESLAGSYDYQAAMRELGQLTQQPRCSFSFTRNDETIRPTYELMREGRLPEGQTFFAQLLNRVLTTPEELEKSIVRRQRIDGSQLPSFELARRYFGPSARAVTAEDDGWFITGVVLNKAGQ